LPAGESLITASSGRIKDCHRKEESRRGDLAAGRAYVARDKIASARGGTSQ
jgi:hypothetical protein